MTEKTDKIDGFKNIGWSLGNTCNLNCAHCYSRSVRNSDKELTESQVDHIIREINKLTIQTINLGGNEPIFMSSGSIEESLLPYIIDSISKKDIKIGLTSSGISVIELQKYFSKSLSLINDIDISIDSPRKIEHDKNRGKHDVFEIALDALDLCQSLKISRSIIMCAMQWNFTEDRINELIDLALKYDCNIRINPFQPVQMEGRKLILTAKQYYNGLSVILQRCSPICLSDPLWASISDDKSISGCPCGTTSFRINSITQNGTVPISPCIYLHDYKCGDLLTMDIIEILKSKPFSDFQVRQSMTSIAGCENCTDFDICHGGCASRAYLFAKQDSKQYSVFLKDPYCYIDLQKKRKKVIKDVQHKTLVHENYLCTGIFKPII